MPFWRANQGTLLGVDPRLIEPEELARMARGSGLVGAGELEAALRLRARELIAMRASEASGLLPTYEARLARARDGDGPVVIGLEHFVEALRTTDDVEIFGITTEDRNFVGLVQADRMIALSVISPPA